MIYETYLSKNSIKEDPKYHNWTVMGGRLKTFEEIRKLLSLVYPINVESERKIKENLLKEFYKKALGDKIFGEGFIIKGVENYILKKETPIEIRNYNYNNITQTTKLSGLMFLGGNKDENLNKIDVKIGTGVSLNCKKNTIEKGERFMIKGGINEKKEKTYTNPYVKDNIILNENQINEFNNKNSTDIGNAENINKNNNKKHNKNSEVRTKNVAQNRPLSSLNAKINNNNNNSSFNNSTYNNKNRFPKNNNKTNTNQMKTSNKNDKNSTNNSNSTYYGKDNNASQRNKRDLNNSNSQATNILKQNLLHQFIKSSYDIFTYDPSSFSLDTLLVDSHPIRACSFSAGGEMLAIGTNSQCLKLYDFSQINNLFVNRTKEKIISLPLLFEKQNHHNGSIYCLDWSKNEKIIATGSNDKMIKIFVVPDLSTKPTEFLELAIPDQRGTVRTILFNPEDESYLISGGSMDSNINVWDTESGGKIQSLLGHNGDIHTLKFSIDNNGILGSTAKDKKINFYDLKTDKPIFFIDANNHGEINDITFTNDYICAGFVDGYINVYSNVNKCLIKEYKASETEIRALNFSLDGKYLLCASFDSKLRIFDFNNELKLVKTLEHDDKVVNCKWHPDKPIFISTSRDKTARIWSPKVY